MRTFLALALLLLAALTTIPSPAAACPPPELHNDGVHGAEVHDDPAVHVNLVGVENYCFTYVYVSEHIWIYP